MKKLLFFTMFIFTLNLVFPTFSFAQGMMGESIASEENDNHTVLEEVEGKEIWEKLQAEELKCGDLSDNDFGVLGEYFMGQMAGGSHEAMNKMMMQMMGEEGEQQMHVAMGKRMSNCEPDAPMPQKMTNRGMMSTMMNMMMGGGGSSMMGSFGTNSMSLFGFGWLFMILFWGLVILGIIALIKWLMNQSKGETKGKPALDILKERYAKGEINKKEFEEKKKDLI